MPEEKLRQRGGVKRVRTVRIGKNRYAHVFVVPAAGPRGGHTELGKAKLRKGGKHRGR